MKVCYGYKMDETSDRNKYIENEKKNKGRKTAAF